MTALDRFTVDTNILVYSIDKTDKKKHKKAIETLGALREKDTFLTLQCMSEAFYVLTRKQKVSFEDAERLIEYWELLFPIVSQKPTTLNAAIKGVKRYKLSFWDAMLWAVAKDAGASVLITEDFNHSQEIGGVKIVDPFKIPLNKLFS